MALADSYPLKTTPVAGDKILSSDSEDGGKVKNILVSDLLKVVDYPPVTKTADYTTTADDHNILVDGSANTVEITLRTAVGISGKTHNIKCIADTYACTLACADGIDGEIEQYLLLHESMTVQSDGTTWWII